MRENRNNSSEKAQKLALLKKYQCEWKVIKLQIANLLYGGKITEL